MVGLVEETLAAAFDRQRLVCLVAMAVARDERVRTVIFEQDIFTVVDVAGNDTVRVLITALPYQKVSLKKSENFNSLNDLRRSPSSSSFVTPPLPNVYICARANNAKASPRLAAN